MRKLITAATIVASLATLAVPAVSMASTGTSNGQSGKLTGNNAAKYNDPVFGSVQCNETQHAKFDTLSCKSTTGSPLTNVAPGQVGTVGWNSDFGAVSGTTNIHPVTGTLAYTVSADGLSYTGQATYNS